MAELMLEDRTGNGVSIEVSVETCAHLANGEEIVTHMGKLYIYSGSGPEWVKFLRTDVVVANTLRVVR